MHEASITQSLLEVALERAQEANARKITQINLIVGDLDHITDENLQFHFDLASKGTIAEGARLNFMPLPTEFGDHDNLIQGEELYVQSLEVE